MLSIRKRGKYYYVRGTVRVGKETIVVKEQSTGFDRLSDSREYVAKLESDIRDSVLNPNQDRSKKTTFDDCLTLYLNKRRPKVAELQKIKILLPHFEGVFVSDIIEAWNRFLSVKNSLAPSTIQRYATIIKSILSLSKEELNITPPKIKTVSVKNQVVFLLPEKVRPLLLSCYSDHARPIFTVYAYQGLREQENLQLQWEDVDFKRCVIFIRTSKNGESRQAPMHKKTWWVLARQWIKQGKPITGHVWITTKGKPYTDTRKTGCGGSPIRKAHILALQRLKNKYNITVKMNIHSWRHDWCARMVMSGVDLLTIQKLGGWKSLEMVKRYSAFSTQHEIDAINKLKD